jgi:hypothetical protein
VILTSSSRGRNFRSNHTFEFYETDFRQLVSSVYDPPKYFKKQNNDMWEVQRAEWLLVNLFIYFPEDSVCQTQTWMPTYVSILRIPQMIWVWRAPVEWYWQGKAEQLGEKPVPVPLCPPQIPHGLTLAWTRASAVRGWWLTTWAMARPIYLFMYLFIYLSVV